MSSKFFYLYIIAGIVALLLMIYDVVGTYPAVSAVTVLAGVVPALIFFYLAYKVWHEKNDSELM